MLWIVVIVSALTAIYYLLKKKYQYWTNLGVPQTKPVLLFGDHWSIVFRQRSLADLVKYVYNVSPGTRYSGMYQFLTPVLVLKDPELIKQITVKDFDHFTDHGSFMPDSSDDVWCKNVFVLKGKPWKDMRSNLSPSFTSRKMRQIFTLILDVSQDFVKYFKNQNENSLTEIEMKDVFTRYTNDVIATSAFGVKVDSLTHRNNEFYLMGKEASNFSGLAKVLKLFIFQSFPDLYKKLNLDFMSKSVGDFFVKLVKETIQIREEHNIVRPDLINLLLETRKGIQKQDEKEELDAGFAAVNEVNFGEKSRFKTEITDIDIAAQALVFFLGGFDTVSALMCFTAYELAVHSDIQNKLRQEINEVVEETNGKITYESILKMKYLDMVVSESLRKWPLGTVVDRICTKSYTIEPTSSDEVPVHLEKGSVVWLPIYGIHHDPEYYPEPEKFDPERFSDENKGNIHPYSYIPFGSGPRNCIGSRFALLETKAVFFFLLKDFEIVPTTKTQIPLKLCKKQIMTTAEKGFWLGLKPLKN